MASFQEKNQEQSLHLESIVQGDLTWLNIEQPGQPEIDYLARHYPFHPLDLDDCLSRIQRPKIDEYEEYLFVVLHFPVFDAEARVTTSSQVSVFISDKYIITLHKGELRPLVSLFRQCQLDEKVRDEYFNQGSGYLLYRLLDRLVDYCLPILNKIGENIERVEDNIFAEGVHGVVKEISILRRDVISFRRIVWPMRAVIASLESKVRRYTDTDLSVYFDDMVDHVDKLWDGLDEYKEIIEGLNDTNNSLATNRTNEVVRILTAIATILLPIVVVSSVYGMNIPLPFQDSGYAFLFFFSIMLVVIAGMLFLFRRQRWI